MSRAQEVRFGVLEHDPSCAAPLAWALAAARNRADGGVCWLPSGDFALTVQLEHTLKFLGAACTVQRPDTDSLRSELNTRGVALPEAATEVQALTSGAAPLAGSAWCAGQPVVLGIGDDGARQACRFSALTGRPVRLLPDRSALRSSVPAFAGASSLLIAPGADLDNELLHELDAALDDAGLDLPHGWLYPFGSVERDHALLKCVIFGRSTSGPRPFHLLYPLEASADVRAANGDRWVFGQALPAADAVELLHQPADFLAITGHSNGIDMGVGHAVLCPRETPAPQGAHRMLPCFHGAECSRKNPHNELCRVSSIRSVVTLLYTCWGAVLDRHTFDVRGSLLFDLAKSPATAAVVTTYASTLMDAGASVEIAQQFAQQVSLGEAVRSANAEHHRRYRDARRALTLFGDPEHCGPRRGPLLDAALQQSAPIARLLRRRRIEEAQPGTDDEHQRAYAAGIVKRITAIDHLRLVVSGHRALQLDAIAPALAQVGEHLDHLWLWQTRHLLRARQYGAAAAGVPGVHYGRELQQVHTGFFEFFGGMVAHLGGLLHLQTDGVFVDDGASDRRLPTACPYCGSASLRVFQRMVADERIARQLHKCDNCAVVQDGDASISDARFVAAELWPQAQGAALGLHASFDAQASSVPYLAGAIVEPFQKRRQAPPLRVVHRGTLGAGSTALDVAFDTPPLPEGLVPGSYFLNGLILIGERHAFVRRAIYLN